MDQRLSRRQLISVIGLGAIGSIAGCSSSDDSGDDDGSDDNSSDTNQNNQDESDSEDQDQSDNQDQQNSDNEQENEDPEPAEFEIVSTSGSGTYTVGDTIELVATVRNVGGQAGTFDPPLEYSVPSTDEWQEETEQQSEDGSEDEPLEIPAGETREWTSNQVTAERESIGTLQVRFADYNAQWQFTIEPDSYAPQIQNVSLVETDEQYDGELVNTLSSAQSGEIIKIGFVYEYIMQNQELNVFEQCRVYNTETGERVGSRTFEDQQIFGRNGYTVFEHGLQFDTTGWGAGEYQAEIIIRDNISGEVSNRETTTFTLE
ncbi:hypothetical protein [Halovenus halobia]|uniref:hypothetical protein n=1 Tax=Halovenus halobia TaxID=3396622 RepID=UPI003F55DFB7